MIEFILLILLELYKVHKLAIAVKIFLFAFLQLKPTRPLNLHHLSINAYINKYTHILQKLAINIHLIRTLHRCTFRSEHRDSTIRVFPLPLGP